MVLMMLLIMMNVYGDDDDDDNIDDDVQSVSLPTHLYLSIHQPHHHHQEFNLYVSCIQPSSLESSPALSF